MGEGTYAVVYEAHDTTLNRRVAIKKIKMTTHGTGLDISAIRELRLLRELHHPNIATLQDVYAMRHNLVLVLDFYDVDLEMIIKDLAVAFTPADIKSWMLMLLRGLAHCHQRLIIHRDIKPNNLLIASDGLIKIADFGLARVMDVPVEPMTSSVVTRWYRAPELLFGARYYGPGVDIWAAGCIFAELMLRTPFLVGDSDMGQLKTIFSALGTPTEQDWPGMTQLPDYVQFPKQPAPTSLGTLFTAAPEDALDLLSKMLLFDPSKRISAMDALAHPYFVNAPRPTAPAELPKTDPIRFQKAKEAAQRQQMASRLAEIEPRRLFW